MKKGEGETEPLIEPLRKVKEPSLSLVRLIIKHYGGTILIVRKHSPLAFPGDLYKI